jgi:hypothetical protein
MGLLSLAIWSPIFVGVLLLALGRDDQSTTVRWIALVGAAHPQKLATKSQGSTNPFNYSPYLASQTKYVKNMTKPAIITNA